ncbi:hypothetical protein SGCZBJ_20085 [Caulobacter zeae]|uniref:Uncharacterized protein n=1 Tax=Caulobacter zeae TaxID=2055137 RepID=A0A2N5D734_9CAUL|nr:hypothetical protein [Caulobacter zeae]PLR21875.1 hypothetical protein SGCZBJ_20085 [Caulobacter zeae]
MSGWRLAFVRTPGVSVCDVVLNGVVVHALSWDWSQPRAYPVVQHPFETDRTCWLHVIEIDTVDVQLAFAMGDAEDDVVVYYLPADAGDPNVVQGRDPLFEGHWRALEAEASNLPWPRAEPEWSGRDEFLAALEHVEVRAEVVDYRGLSHCRVCSRVNGYRAFRLDRWEWPEGFRHYVEDHGQRPTEAFVRFIAAQAAWLLGSETSSLLG